MAQPAFEHLRSSSYAVHSRASIGGGSITASTATPPGGASSTASLRPAGREGSGEASLAVIHTLLELGGDPTILNAMDNRWAWAVLT